MARVVIDAMGGDLAPEAAVEGAANLSLEPGDDALLLVGDVRRLAPLLDAVRYDPARLALVHAEDDIAMDEPPREALAAKPEASVLVALRLLAAGEADALVTAGHTGALLLGAREHLGLLPGVRRAALAAVYPTEARHGPHGDPFALILDAGATVKAGARDLVSFAAMGTAYSSIISDIPRPRVALLSNGTEATKGTPALREAYARLAAGPLHFVGNVEGLDIPRGRVDGKNRYQGTPPKGSKRPPV